MSFAASRTTVDTDAIDLSQEPIRLADDVAVWPAWENGEIIYRLESRHRQRFYRVGFREYTFLSLLDGSTSVAAACGLAAAKLGTTALTSDESESIAVWLLSEGLASVRGTSARPAKPETTSLWKRLNPFWIQVPLAKSSDSLNSFFRMLSPVFGFGATLAGLVVILIGVFAYLMHREALHRSSGDFFSSSGWIYFLLTWMILKFVHELGHAAVCKRLGGEVSEVGVVFMLFAPLAYVDVTSCWRLPRVLPRVLVSLAGMYVELVIAAVAMLAWLACDSVALRFWLANIVITAGVSTIVFNANPLMRFDGYYILSDMLQIPNLYGEASSELKRVSRFVFYGDSAPGGYSLGKRRYFLIAYGLAAFVWRILICLTLCVTASFMFSGAGIALAGLGVLAWFGQPIRQFVLTALEDSQIDQRRFLRSIATGSATFVGVVGILFFPFRTGVSLPGVIHDPPGAEVRSVAEGFVTEVHVYDGARVKSGQPLLTLRNEALVAEMRHLELNRDAAQMQVRFATNSHDASAAWVARKELNAIEQQIAELRPKVDGLCVVAPQDGVVSSRELEFALGRFIREGDELLRLSGIGTKEVIAAAHQDQIEAVRGLQNCPVQVSNARLQKYDSVLQAVEPRASNRLPDPALSALRGGPLQVRSVDVQEDATQDDNVRLVEPHFIVRAPVREQDETHLMTGSRVQLLLGYRRLSLWNRAHVAIEKFIFQKSREQRG